MASLEELRTVRIEKMNKLRDAGMNPYTARTDRSHTNQQVVEDFEALEKGGDVVILSGRVMAIRGQGAILFVPLFDGTETFQGVFKKDEIDKNLFSLFTDTIDVGDFIEITGTLFTTQKGAQSLLVKEWKVLTKSLRPLPDKHDGLKDVDERYRKRYLDILMDPEMREMFNKKAAFWKAMRNFMEDKGFAEVHTPTLEVTTGGAEAEPFATHHNDYDIDVFLRISVGELWQKRLMAAGFPKTYEIGRAYRNEGTSPNHLQEFTNMEFYWAYADFNMGMGLVQELYQTVAQQVFGTTQFTSRDHEFDLAGDWGTIDYRQEIQKQTGIDITTASQDELEQKINELGITSEALTQERMTDSLWKYCRKSIAGPVFVTGYPEFMQPLAKKSDQHEGIVEQFQVLIAGAEVGKGYSELNDPLDQAARFEHQQSLREAGDKEAMMPDWDFVEMLEHGMPPTCGFGVGDRLFAFLVDKPIRETVLFPLMKPRGDR